MKACQSRYRSACIWHAIPGKDLCPACAKAEAGGEHIPRIVRPVFDRDGKRIRYAEPVVMAPAVHVEEIPF